MIWTDLKVYSWLGSEVPAMPEVGPAYPRQPTFRQSPVSGREISSIAPSCLSVRLLSQGLVFPDWLRARPGADFHFDALGALELYMVGIDCPAEFERARGLKPPDRLLLVFDRKPDVFDPEPLCLRPHR